LKYFLVLSLLIGLAEGADGPPRKVVFVCEHGAAKSVIAAAEFEKMAKERGLAVSAVARGTNVDAELSAPVVKGLQADGLKANVTKPIRIQSADAADASRVVTFGPDLSAFVPAGQGVLDWSATPSPGKDYKAARDYIRKQLEGLLAQFEKEAKTK